jgi:hypothetical protein
MNTAFQLDICGFHVHKNETTKMHPSANFFLGSHYHFYNPSN